MKTLMLLVFLIGLGTMVQAQQKNPNYDPALADKLGADAYGMKSYVLVILQTGPASSEDKSLVNKAFAGHMDNIRRLVEEGKLLVAGPLGKNEDQYRGIFIFDVSDVEKAKSMVASDPAIQNGFLKAKFYPWYGSAALPSYLEDADKVWQENP
ncbi:MAG: YciI family protein [Cyclobacteriaceae bacterium]